MRSGLCSATCQSRKYSSLYSPTDGEHLSKQCLYDIGWQAIFFRPTSALFKQCKLADGVKNRCPRQAFSQSRTGTEFTATLQQRNQFAVEFIDMFTHFKQGRRSLPQVRYARFDGGLCFGKFMSQKSSSQ